MRDVICVSDIVELHTQAILLWKASGVTFSQHGLLRQIEENHAFNFQLWLAEDRARREDLGAAFVYHAKRDIDHFNQQRNDRMESIDTTLWDILMPAHPEQCPLHSETPGMMIDRLSILSLKAYHMEQQVLRKEVDVTHRDLCQAKLEIIQTQRDRLSQCLTQLLHETLEKTRTFCIYRQFKMYNDKNLNPELYNQPLTA